MPRRDRPGAADPASDRPSAPLRPGSAELAEALAGRDRVIHVAPQTPPTTRSSTVTAKPTPVAQGRKTRAVNKAAGRVSPVADRVHQALTTDPRTPGERFTATGAGFLKAAGLRGGDETSSRGLQRAFDVPGAIRAEELVADIAGPVDQQTLLAPATQPTPTSVLDLVELLPTDSTEVLELEELPRDGDVHGVPPGASLPDAGIDWTSFIETLTRWGGTLTIPGWHMRSRTRARRIVDGALMRHLRHELSYEIVAGDGSETAERIQLTGLLVRAGSEPGDIPVVGRNVAADETRVEAVDRAASAVQTAEWLDEPITAVAHPQTLRALRDEPAPGIEVGDPAEEAGGTERDGGRRPPPAVDRWVPSTAATQGKVIVGAWFPAVALFATGFDIAAYDQHDSYAEQGWLLLRGRGHVRLWVRHPTALRIVDLDPS